MRNIRILSITLRNWRGAKELTTKFNAGAPTYICGDNGTGKSRHFDAFCWLLFGKDSQDRKDYEIRTYDSQHNMLHKCECSVEATLDIDGAEVTLKRESKEKWVKPRGSADEVFQGNVTECSWNGTPVRVGDFQKRISCEIISEDTFKAVTNPRFFCETLKWQQQREVLLSIAGSPSDAETAASSKDFQSLLAELNGTSLDEHRKQLAVTRKRLKAELDEIRPRIDQTQKLMPPADDWNAIEKELKATDKRSAELSAQLASIAERNTARDTAVSAINRQIRGLEDRQEEIMRAERKRLQDEADKANGKRRETQQSLSAAHSELAQTNIDISRAAQRKESLFAQLKDIDKKLASLRAEWYDVNARKYDGSTVCPHCGQQLPDEMIAEAIDIFDKDKSQRLADINERGRQLKEQKGSLKEELAQLDVEKLQQKAREKQSEIDALSKQLDGMPLKEPEAPEATSLPQWRKIEEQIDNLLQKKSGAQASATDNSAEIRAEIEKLQASARQLQARLSKRDELSRLETEVNELDSHGKELAQQIADVERKEYIAQQFARKKILDCEERINKLFTRVRWQLFDYTQDGNEFECCTPLVDGKPYGVANTALQMNAGLDIINALCKYYNISAPIFIDAAESTRHYIDTIGQLVFLCVTSDKELVIKDSL